MKKFITLIFLIGITTLSQAQDITNTLGTSGKFIVNNKDNKELIDINETNLVFSTIVSGTSTVQMTIENNGKVNISTVLQLTPSAPPTTPEPGDIYVNDTNKHVYCFIGGIWKQLDN